MKNNITHLRIAMNMADIQVNDAAVETFLLCYDLVKKKGGKGTLQDACKIRQLVNEKYKGTDVIHPDKFWRDELAEKDETISDQQKIIKTQSDQLADIHQLADLIVSNPNLRPRVLNTIANEIDTISSNNLQ